MPWDPKEFARKHNHSLKGAAAAKASRTANALLAKGYPDSSAIRIANAQAKRGKSPGRGIINRGKK